MLAIPVIAAIVLATQDGDGRTQALIDQLRADGVKWNAIHSMEALAEVGSAAIPQLEQALHSDDWQQRMMAADTLRGIEQYRPTQRMLEVCVEGLRDDELPNGRHADGNPSDSPPSNAARGFEYLLKHVDRAEAVLVAALDSKDAQQRFIAALTLGLAGRTCASGRVCQVLVYHLKDNDIRGDSILAAAALRHMGVSAVPGLMLRREKASGQQQVLIDLVLAHTLQKSPDEIEECIRRAGRIGWPLDKDPTAMRIDEIGSVPFRWWRVDWSAVTHDG